MNDDKLASTGATGITADFLTASQPGAAQRFLAAASMPASAMAYARSQSVSSNAGQGFRTLCGGGRS
jgi:hypothetical protein